MTRSTFAGRFQDLESWLLAGASSPFIVNEKDGSVMVWIPAGEFEMGDCKNSDCPKHSVYLDGYYLGVYCVTNRQYKVFVEETGHRAPDQADHGTPIWKGKSYPAKYGEHPVVCVSWEDALAYCAWAGLQLPTEAQWEKGARGPGGLLYPWGNDWNDFKCRNDKNKGNGTTSRVFDYSSGVSGYGTYNQSGNVWELCLDWYGSDYYGVSPRENPTGPVSGSRRVSRGGGWHYDVVDYFRAAYRSYDGPAYRDDYNGFRACLSPGQQRVK